MGEGGAVGSFSRARGRRARAATKNAKLIVIIVNMKVNLFRV
jgi:hypothetical protein